MTSEELDLFVRAFIDRDRRERWRTLLGSDKRRKRLVATFAHGHDFDPRWATPLGTGATVQSVVALLRSKGANETCTLLSEDPRLDGAALPLEEAIGAVLRQGFGAYLVCDPGRLAFFESEDVGGHYLLERPAALRAQTPPRRPT